MTALPAAIIDAAPETSALRARAESELSALTEQQRRYVMAFCEHGNSVRAAKEAGYKESSAKDIARRLRANPVIRAAIAALARARGAEVAYGPDELRRLLETALDVSPEIFMVRNEAGDLVGVRDLDSLSPGERMRVRSLTAKVRKSAQGNRAHLVNLEVELVNPLEIIDRLAKLQQLYSSESVAANVAALGQTTVAPSFDPLWAEVLDALLSESELQDYFAANSDEERWSVLRPAVDRLRASLPTTGDSR
jgi:hypothetical protein